MTKKHFIELADSIRIHNNYADDKFTANQIKVLADFCKSMNGQFDRERWLDYIGGKCGPSGGKIKAA